VALNEVRRFARNTAGFDVAVGDIHGCVSKFLVALGEIGFDPSHDRCFSVGDLVDRGPESHRCDELIAQPWFFAVQGNHEDFAIRWPNGHMDAGNYAANGGAWNIGNTHDERVRYADLLGSLPVAMEVETEGGLVGIVHADCPHADWWRFTRELEDASSTRGLIANVRELCMWNRTRVQTEDRTPVAGVRAVIVGHTPMRQPMILGNVYHIDTMGWKQDGRFTFVDLETLGIVQPKRAGASSLVWEA
jgi:serine/threonine protein phosphatase 1